MILESQLSHSFTQPGKVWGWQCIYHVYHTKACGHRSSTDQVHTTEECWQGEWLVFVGTNYTGRASEVRKAHHHPPVNQPGFKPRPAGFPVKYSSLPLRIYWYTSVSPRAWMRNKHTDDSKWILFSCFIHTHPLRIHLYISGTKVRRRVLIL